MQWLKDLRPEGLLAPARRRNPLQTSATNLKPPLKETMKMRLIVALTLKLIAFKRRRKSNASNKSI